MRLLTLLLFLVCVSCATRTPVTDSLVRKGEDARIENVPLIRQQDYHCGPASLAMVLQHHGSRISAQDAARNLFHKELKGTFFTELKGKARELGYMVLELNDLRKAFTEVRSGHPVIVLQNNGFRFLPRWHFSVLTGMDFDGPDVLLHDGDDRVRRVDMRLFERSFILGGRRALVILPPEKLATTSGELEHVEAATLLEAIGKTREAQAAYLSILKKWPTSLVATIGAANTLYASGEKRAALAELEKGTSHHPGSPLLWHNLAIIQGELGSPRARKSAKKALGLASGESKAKFRVSLKEWL